MRELIGFRLTSNASCSGRYCSRRRRKGIVAKSAHFSSSASSASSARSRTRNSDWCSDESGLFGTNRTKTRAQSAAETGLDEAVDDGFDVAKIFSVNDVYELSNLSKLKSFVYDNTNGLRDAHLVVLCGDFLSPSLLSSLDSGRAAVSVMNKVPFDFVCLGNHEFDHGTSVLKARLEELNAVCLNTNVEVKTCEDNKEKNEEEKEECVIESASEANVGFLRETTEYSVIDLGGLKIALLGLCTTTTPLSAAKKPKGVTFANCAEKTLNTLSEIQKELKTTKIDCTIALTHQTLSEDDEYIRKVGEDKLDLILGGHEHQPFIGLVGDNEDVSKDAKKGVLCVKAGMDAENVVVVTIRRRRRKQQQQRSREKEKIDQQEEEEEERSNNNNNNNNNVILATTGGNGAGSRKNFSGVARAMSTSGEWDTKNDSSSENVEDNNNNNNSNNSGSSSSSGALITNGTTKINKIIRNKDANTDIDIDECDEECERLAWEIDGIPDSISDDYPGWDAVPNETLVTVEKTFSTLETDDINNNNTIQITAELIDLTNYHRTDEEIDKDIYERSKVLRELHEFILPVHIHAERLALHPLSSKNARQQQCTLGTLFATMLRDEHSANACLYNSGGMRANATYDLKRQPFTYGDLTAEVPFENSIVKLEMSGREFAAAVAFSERSKSEHASWGGYLQWDAGCQTVINPKTGRCEVTHIAKEPIDMKKTYTVVTWGGLLEGTDGIPQFQRAGERMARKHFGKDFNYDDLMVSGFFHEGTPFKTLVIRHICRWRWRELQHKCTSFENLDYDEDGLLSASDIEHALIEYTDSKSPRLEAESMVRLFESGLQDDKGGVSKSSLDICLEPFWKTETSVKLVEYEQSQLSSGDDDDIWWLKKIER